MQSFDEFLYYFSEKLNCEIEELRHREPSRLYEPVIYTLKMGGKRVRPVLLLMAYSLYANDLTTALPAAFTIEIFHNFTLLHDDIMDNADLRRNNKTVHIKYSDNTAILSGDAMSILAYEYLAFNNGKNYKKVNQLFTETALKICEGQQFDMDFEDRDNVTVTEYLKMIELKTAVLLACSLKMGGLLAKAPKYECELLYNFGLNLGMAFQLQDDYLDSFGEQESFGKNIGGDIVSNKKTFLMLKALELAENENRTALKRWLDAKDFDRKEKIRGVKAIYENSGVAELTRQMMEEYYEKALSCWEAINAEGAVKNELLAVAQNLMKRRS